MLSNSIDSPPPTTTSSPPSIEWVILGGGLSGLTLAWTLDQLLQNHPDLPIHLTLIESTDQWGGWIQSSSPSSNSLFSTTNAILEKGPRTVRAQGTGKAALELIDQLGLTPQILWSSPEAKRRYRWNGRYLEVVPSHPIHLLSPKRWPLAWTLGKEFFLRSQSKHKRCKASLDGSQNPSDRPHSCIDRTEKKGEEESVSEFFTRRFGSRFTQEWVDPLVSGIFAGDPDLLSARACFPHFVTWEEEYRSVLRGALQSRPKKNSPTPPSPLFTLQGGLATLPKTIVAKLRQSPRVTLLANTTPVSIERLNGGWSLSLSQTLHADHLFAALPAKDLAPLLSTSSQGPLQKIASLLREVPFASVIKVHLSYRQALPLKRGGGRGGGQRRGFGYLIPSNPRKRRCNEGPSPVLGVIWDSYLFDRRAPTQLTVILGGSRHPELVTWQEDQLIELCQMTLKKHLDITTQPHHVVVQKAHQAIPQYTVGHLKRLEAIESIIEQASLPLTFLGASTRGLAIGDIIVQATSIAQQVIDRVSV